LSEARFGTRYTVTERIGTGGMADVYKGMDDVLGRTVAVKVMHRQYAADPTFVQRFRQEAQAAANLASPNIVNIFDWGQQEDTYYIVMEYVRGTDLKTLLEQRGPMDPKRVADYGAQVCSALGVAHGYDIIHRDIKPQNLILTPDGVVKVTDFGIARAGNTSMTQTGSVLGTAYYLSPEQAQGRSLTPASDLYSLGIVLYELTTGKLPFVGDSPVSTALKQVNEAPVPPRQLNPSIPAGMEAVILKAMLKNPSERYQTSEEMKADLKAVAQGLQPSAAGAMLGAAGAGFAGAGTGSDATSVMGRVPGGPPAGPAAQRPLSPAPSAKKKSRAWVWILLALLALLALGGIAWAAFGGQLSGPPPVNVPAVNGRTLREAQSSLVAAGLVIGKVTTATSDSVAAGLVISQDPTAGTSLAKGGAVSLVVSAGKPTATVPDLSGKTEPEAVNALQQAGFIIGARKFTNSADVAAGLVITQDPAAGTTADRGTPVNFSVSKGKAKGTVPDVVGKSRATAISLIQNAGFTAQASKEYSDTVAEDQVIRQSPDPGSSADAGATVKFVVSRGPQTFKMPNVVGMATADAKAQLENLGLKVTTTEVSPPKPADVGRVITSIPGEGATMKSGDPVTITVGSQVVPPGNSGNAPGKP
jgi:beta-lactam-binding protein with PASTA domain/tRNA A-37 threonylcarbamoyl transferase component Bud32